MRPIPSFTQLLVALILILGPTQLAEAQSVEDTAGIMLFEAGKEAFDRGDYDGAAEKFDKSLSVAFGGEVSAATAPAPGLAGKRPLDITDELHGAQD